MLATGRIIKISFYIPTPFVEILRILLIEFCFWCQNVRFLQSKLPFLSITTWWDRDVESFFISNFQERCTWPRAWEHFTTLQGWNRFKKMSMRIVWNWIWYWETTCNFCWCVCVLQLCGSQITFIIFQQSLKWLFFEFLKSEIIKVSNAILSVCELWHYVWSSLQFVCDAKCRGLLYSRSLIRDKYA